MHKCLSLVCLLPMATNLSCGATDSPAQPSAAGFSASSAGQPATAVETAMGAGGTSGGAPGGAASPPGVPPVTPNPDVAGGAAALPNPPPLNVGGLGAEGDPTHNAVAGAASQSPVAPSTNTSLPAHWHESKSFGTNTKGGIEGEVCRVTNLDNGGGGSLKDCVSGSNKLVVFEVGGVIDLNGGGMSIGGSNITVAGQTAPSPGISIIKGNLSVGGSDVVLSHIAIQRGDGPKTGDGSNITGDNIVYDHVSVWWGTDETMSIHGVNNVTMFKSIVAESLQFAGHADIEHSKGSLINNGPSSLAMVGSLFSNNAARNPRVDGGEIFLANHVVHNWGRYWDEPAGKSNRPANEAELATCTLCFNKPIAIRSGCNAALVNSVALRGPDGLDGKYFIAGHSGSADLFEEGNIIIDQQGNPLTVVNPEEINALPSAPLWPTGFVPLPADEGFYEVLRTAGPRPGDRDAHHARLIRQIAEEDTGKSEIIDSQDDVGGYPAYPMTTRPIGDIPAGAAERQAWLDGLEDEIAVDRQADLSRLYGLIGSAASDKLR